MKNFGFIKNSFNNILSENIKVKNSKSKSIFKKYVNQLREDDSLRTQFLVYKNIEDKVEKDKAKAIEFVKENIALMGKFPKAEIKRSLNKLLALKPTIVENQDIYFGDDKKRVLHENISYLILTDKNTKTVGSIVEAIDAIAEYIVGNEKRVVSEQKTIIPSLYVSVIVEKYNEKYEELSEGERKALRIIMESNQTEKEVFFKESLKECLEVVNKTMVGNISIEEKEGLLAAKESLLNKTFTSESFITDITKILELTNDLK